MGKYELARAVGRTVVRHGGGIGRAVGRTVVKNGGEIGRAVGSALKGGIRTTTKVVKGNPAVAVASVAVAGVSTIVASCVANKSNQRMAEVTKEALKSNRNIDGKKY